MTSETMTSQQRVKDKNFRKWTNSNCSFKGVGPVEIGCANLRPLNGVPCRKVCQMLNLSRGYCVKAAIDLLQNGNRKKCRASFQPVKLQTMEVKRAKRSFFCC